MRWGLGLALGKLGPGLLDKDEREKHTPKENDQGSSVHPEHRGTVAETTATGLTHTGTAS